MKPILTAAAICLALPALAETAQLGTVEPAEPFPQ